MVNDKALEISRPLSIERLGERGFETQFVASENERKALAARFGILAIDRLEASLSARKAGPGTRVRLTGQVTAEVVQACVVSLEPVKSVVSEDFSQLYQLDPAETAAKEVEVSPSADDDEPEPLGPGGLDLGEAVAQQLALMLDPYPRRPGAKSTATTGMGSAEGESRRHPFEVLKALKPR